MPQLVITSLNTLGYCRRVGRTHEARYEQVEQLVLDIDPDVILLQEMPGDDRDVAASGLQRLARATKMRCVVSGGRDSSAITTAAPGGHHRLALGIMWRSTIDPVPDTWHEISGGPLWHGLIAQTLDAGGRKISVATYHAPPRDGRDHRSAEAQIISSALIANSNGHEIILGGDWNSISARRLPDGSYYDPDPADTITDDDRRGWADDPPEISFPTDREPDRILANAGYLDVAVWCGAPWMPTTGHWDADRNGPRRLDRILCRRPGHRPAGRPAVFRVHDTPVARSTSDHLPAVYTHETPNHAGAW